MIGDLAPAIALQFFCRSQAPVYLPSAMPGRKVLASSLSKDTSLQDVYPSSESVFQTTVTGPEEWVNGDWERGATMFHDEACSKRKSQIAGR